MQVTSVSRALNEPRTHLSPPQIARWLGVGHEKVLRWIRSGELRAINLAAKRSGRPRYRVRVADLVAFENGRQVVQVDVKPRRRRKSDDSVVEFF